MTALRDRVREQVRPHEGFRARAYKDSRGIWTGGIGRNLEDCGLSRREVIDLLQIVDMPEAFAVRLLDSDIDECIGELRTWLTWFDTLDEIRQAALCDMAFQLGTKALLKFRKMLAAMAACNWDEAERQALNSDWARETPNRAREVARSLRTGSAT